MNKEQLITRNYGVKLYDLSSPKEMQLMKQNLYDCSKANRDPSFKLIAPFGHPLKFKADFYYFESENTPITDQILEEMGFDGFVLYDLFINKFYISYCNGVISLDDKTTNIKTANQLHQLITLLSSSFTK